MIEIRSHPSQTFHRTELLQMRKPRLTEGFRALGKVTLQGYSEAGRPAQVSCQCVATTSSNIRRKPGVQREEP